MNKRMRTTRSKDLPEDVLLDILSRLPVKTLMKLRCVCKSWYSIISHPTFINTHFNRTCLYNNGDGYLQCLNWRYSGRPPVWCLLSDYTYIDRLELEFPLDPLATLGSSLVGTINGLVCFSDFVHTGRTICLWNPSIRKSRTLPWSSSTFSLTHQHNLINYLVIGFGFHSQTNDFKIVRILYLDYKYIGGSTSPPVEVYSLITDSWKGIEALVPCYGSRQESDVFFNGYVHWIANKSVAYPDHLDTIMSFDIGGEVFGEMTLPNYHAEEVVYPDLKLAVLKESLSLCVCFEEKGNCDIWVMSEYSVVESWSKQFSIVLPQTRIKRSFGFTKNDVVFLETSSGQLVSYDLVSLQHKKYPGIRLTYSAGYVSTFMETLVLL